MVPPLLSFPRFNSGWKLLMMDDAYMTGNVLVFLVCLKWLQLPLAYTVYIFASMHYVLSNLFRSNFFYHGNFNGHIHYCLSQNSEPEIKVKSLNLIPLFPPGDRTSRR